MVVDPVRVITSAHLESLMERAVCFERVADEDGAYSNLATSDEKDDSSDGGENPMLDLPRAIIRSLRNEVARREGTASTGVAGADDEARYEADKSSDEERGLLQAVPRAVLLDLMKRAGRRKLEGRAVGEKAAEEEGEVLDREGETTDEEEAGVFRAPPRVPPYFTEKSPTPASTEHPQPPSLVQGHGEYRPSKKQRERDANRQRRANRRRRKIEEGGHVARPAVRTKLIQVEDAIATNLQTQDLPVANGAYQALNLKPAADMAEPVILDLKKAGYRYIEWDGELIRLPLSQTQDIPDVAPPRPKRLPSTNTRQYPPSAA